MTIILTKKKHNDDYRARGGNIKEEKANDNTCKNAFQLLLGDKWQGSLEPLTIR